MRVNLNSTFNYQSTMRSDFLVCSMYTKNYTDKAMRLANSLQTLKIDFQLYEVPCVHQSISPKGTSDLNYTKGNVILNLLAEHKIPILYIDADCEVLKPLNLFSKLIKQGYDFAIYNWLSEYENTAYGPTPIPYPSYDQMRYYSLCNKIDFKSDDQLICSGASQFWGNTLASKDFLEAWIKTISLNPLMPDDKSLDFTFNNKLSRSHKLLRPYWLEKKYARYPIWIFDNPIINHPNFQTNNSELVSNEFNYADGKKYIYDEKLRQKINPIEIPLGQLLDTKTGDLLIPAEMGFTKIGSINKKFYL